MPNREEALAGIDPAVIDEFALDLLPFEDTEKSVAELATLAGRRVVVTGGGGGSLGRALVDRFAAAGADVGVLDLDAALAEQVAREAAERWGATTTAIAADVTDWDSIHDALAELAERLGGPIDVLVNNAGGALRTHGPFMDIPPEAMRAVVDLNYMGTLYATRAVLPGMIAAGSGRIVNIAAEGGKTRMPRLAVYTSAKAAVIGFTRNLSEDLRGTGVSVVAVCPGVMVGPHALERMKGGSTDAARASLAHTFDRANLGRFSLPEEVANVAVFLASPAGSYVVGTSVSVGGGMSD